MKQSIVLFFLAIMSIPCFSQEEEELEVSPNDSLTVIDPKYREDQFYFSLTYNLLSQKPEGLKQQGFSAGFHFGFIRDMPINERRNWAIGVGLGLSTNSYNQNLLINEENGGTYEYAIIDEDSISFNKNKFTTYLVELPLELRWRTSTATEYQFWRMYAGVKIGYAFYNSSKFEGDLGTIENTNIADIDRLRYGLTFSAGYSTWNAHIYYGLNSIFGDSATLNDQAIDMTNIKIGLMFYIL